MMGKRNTAACKVISATLFVVGILFLIGALLGHESGYSAATSCLAAAACMNMRLRKETGENVK